MLLQAPDPLQHPSACERGADACTPAAAAAVCASAAAEAAAGDGAPDAAVWTGIRAVATWEGATMTIGTVARAVVCTGASSTATTT